LPAYATFKEIRDDLANFIGYRMLLGALAAVVVQWGTTGAAIITAYLTTLQQQDPNNDVEKDEGPREQVQANGQEEPALNGTDQAVNAGHRGSDQETNSGGSQARLRIYSSLAVAFRLVGGFVVVLNGLWLIAGSLMEIIGVYDNCWCNAEYFGLKDNGWVNLGRRYCPQYHNCSGQLSDLGSWKETQQVKINTSFPPTKMLTNLSKAHHGHITYLELNIL
jgi:hypothetical protein